ncbi:MAG: hypothetical protein FWH08_00855 [Oscillospiraceae bacterium]|nr:hypothetical protein [Oscillospiraceae bacterium]
MKIKKIAIAVAFIVGMFAGVNVFLSSWADADNINTREHIEPAYELNVFGQTYGSAMYAITVDDEPDLILVVGDSGIEGYVYKTDLDEDMPDSPEEAIQKQEELVKEGVFSRTIPVYNKNGITKIDTFTIDMGYEDVEFTSHLGEIMSGEDYVDDLLNGDNVDLP